MLEIIFAEIMSDWIGFGINILFGAFLLPALLDPKQKPPVATSFFTGALLIVLALGGSYKSVATSVACGVTGLLWLTLALQRFLMDRKNKAQDKN